MSQGSEAEIYSIAVQREAREARRQSGSSARARCQAETSQGRRCRNHAVEDGHCRVHLARSGGDTASVPAADQPEVAKRPAPYTAGPADHPRPEPDARWEGDPTRDPDVERVVREQGWGPAVDAISALREELGNHWIDDLRGAADFARRRLTGDYAVDEFGFDEDLTTSLLMPLVRPLHRRYWRVRSHGAQHIPTEGGGLIVANHAGTLPFDAVITRLDIFEETGRHARELAADLVFRTPFIGEFARKTGGTLASNDDADRLLERGELVAVWPEGFKGIGKRFKDRYKLQRFGRGGFVATALRAQVPIVPTAIVGSEEIYPMIYDLRVVARTLGLPYFPVVPQMFALPVLGPLALLPLPSKWIIEYGEPIDTTAYGPEAAEDPMAVFDLTDRVREQIQEMIHENLMGRRSVFL